MMATLPADAVFQFALDADSRLLTAHWSAHAPDVALHGHFKDLLAAAEHSRCRFWLLDLRGRHWQGTQIGQWLSMTFAAQAAQVLGLPIFVACILDPMRREVVWSGQAAASQRACAAHDFYPYFFDNETDARSWLSDQQGLDHVPGTCQPQP